MPVTARNVLVLNAGYEPLHRVSVQHAIRMLVRGVAVVETPLGEETFGPFPRPQQVILTRYVKVRSSGNVPLCTKDRIKKRDRHCAYCRGKAETVDHIKPKSRGGRSDWINLVAACFRCNQKKADRTPAEAGMKLLLTPYVPRYSHAELLAA